MAGIGFELQKILKRNTLASAIQAFLYGSVIASGPMVLTIVTVSIIGFIGRGILQEGAVRLFTAVITYTFAFSLILTSPLQMLLTRFIADKHFVKKWDDLFPAFVTSTTLVVLLSGTVAGIFYSALELYIPVGNTLLFRFLGSAIFVGQSVIWQLMAFISTSKEYRQILIGYILGAILSPIMAYLTVKPLGVNGALSAYALGQWITALFIFFTVIRHYPKSRIWSFEFFRAFRTYPLIALNGFFLSLGIWVDKFVFYAYTGEQAGASLLYTFNYYDVPNFLSLMTLIPGMAYFLIVAETYFYQDFKGFIQGVLREPLLKIEEKKAGMLNTLQSGLKGMARIQGITALLIIIFANPLIVLFGYQGIAVPLFRLLVLAAFFHILNLTLNVYYLYFEFRKDALLLSLFFSLTNALLTLLSIAAGPKYYGFGFLASAILTYLLFRPKLFKQVQNIDYLIYISQPLGDIFVLTRKRFWRRWLDKLKAEPQNGEPIEDAFVET